MQKSRLFLVTLGALTLGTVARPSEASEAERLLDGWVVHEALQRISAEQRTVLLRTFYGGERYGDVAQDLHIPEATARTRAFYGLRALRARLEELGWER